MRSSISRLSPKFIRRLEAVDTAAICDADKGTGSQAVKVMSSTITLRTQHLAVSGKKMIGIARTVQLSESEDFLAVLQGLDEAEEGEVLCVSTKNSTKAVAGGLFLTEAERKGLRGLIVDGAVRDIASMKENGIHCYSISVNPYSGTISHPGKMQMPITCGGVVIYPGDIIIGDDDGVIVSDINSLESIIESAENIVAKEEAIMTSMKNGNGLHSLTNFTEHVANIKKGKESSLRFK